MRLSPTLVSHPKKAWLTTYLKAAFLCQRMCSIFWTKFKKWNGDPLYEEYFAIQENNYKCIEMVVEDELNRFLWLSKMRKFARTILGLQRNEEIQIMNVSEVDDRNDLNTKFGPLKSHISHKQRNAFMESCWYWILWNLIIWQFIFWWRNQMDDLFFFHCHPICTSAFSSDDECVTSWDHGIPKISKKKRAKDDTYEYKTRQSCRICLTQRRRDSKILTLEKRTRPTKNNKYLQ